MSLSEGAQPMKVIGLAPTTVRIALEDCELPGLQDELLTAIEAQSGSMREELGRREGARLDDERVELASNWLLEYRNLLSQISDRPALRRESVTVTTPAEVAHQVVGACAANALERLSAAIAERASRDKMRIRADAACAWVQTLIDLRFLDEGALESIAL
jgi:hypothetical protein